MSSRIFSLLLIASAALLAADKPNREIQELQRDMAQLQEEVKALRQTLDQRIGDATTQMQTIAAAMEKVNSSLAASQEQERKIVPMVAAQSTRVDQVSSTLAQMQQAFGDLTSAINRLQTQVVDIGNNVKVITTPAPKPPSAEEALKSAEADRLGGKYELAAQEYADFLKSYADSPQADLAQFQLGMMHYQLKELETAVADFTAVAQKYPKSQRVADALLYKAKVLQELHLPTEAANTCLELRRKFPRSDSARQCK
jgi:TolA-binding protein